MWCMHARQEPGRMYEYQISDEAPRSFRAAAAPHPDAGFGFIVYGDMGESEHAAAKAPGYGFPAGAAC